MKNFRAQNIVQDGEPAALAAKKCLKWQAECGILQNFGA